MQICASFKHRRDLSAAVAGPHVGRLPGGVHSAAAGGTARGGNGGNGGKGGKGGNGGNAVHLAPMPDAGLAAMNAARNGAGPPGSVEVERFGLKRSLAWELATRRVREAGGRAAIRTTIKRAPHNIRLFYAVHHHS